MASHVQTLYLVNERFYTFLKCSQDIVWDNLKDLEMLQAIIWIPDEGFYMTLRGHWILYMINKDIPCT